MNFQKLYIFSFFWDNGTGDWEGSGSKRSRGLARGVGLAIGMRVMVTDNIETDLGPYKWGSRWNCGYHSSSRWAIDWELACGASTVHAFVHLCQTQSHRSDTFGRPFWQYHPYRATNCIISYKDSREMTDIPCKKTVRRTGQFPITAVPYAFTDYCSQGQTLPYFIVDIAYPPSSTLNLFNLYAALSRSSQRVSIGMILTTSYS